MKDKTFSKWIMRVVLIQGLLMIWASYFLSLLGKDPCQTLSVAVAGEIVFTCLAYYAKATVENLSKHNENWPAPKGSDAPL